MRFNNNFSLNIKIVNYSFNSLYEILADWLHFMRPGEFETFNSLYEIQNGVERRKT